MWLPDPNHGKVEQISDGKQVPVYCLTIVYLPTRNNACVEGEVTYIGKEKGGYGPCDFSRVLQLLIGESHALFAYCI